MQQSLSQHFPPLVRDALAQAAKTPVTPEQPDARAQAIEHAHELARKIYPELFRKEVQ